MNTKLSFEEAKKWCILTWEYRVNNGGSSNLDELIEQYPILNSLRNNCGFCEKYSRYDDNLSTQICGKCPLVIDDDGVKPRISCIDLNHPYLLWSVNKTSANALVVLELIKNTKDPSTELFKE